MKIEEKFDEIVEMVDILNVIYKNDFDTYFFLYLYLHLIFFLKKSLINFSIKYFRKYLYFY